MVKNRLLIIALCLSLTVSLCGLIYGMVSVDVTNHFETGIVDISLIEYQKTGDKETLWEDNPTILPGSLISKIPRIHNKGNDCYVRAKITFREIEDLNENHLVGFGDNWFKADDGYYYYTKILPHGEDTDIFQGLSVPTDFSQENEGKKFYIDIDVDAIQSQNFTPQFNMAAPWGDIEILTNEKSDYDVDTFKPSDTQSFRIVYQGDAGKLIKNADDFFMNIPYLMPGDTYSDTVTLKNDGSEKIKLHFRSVATEDSELLDKIQLKITTEIGGNIIEYYEGSLRAAALAEDSLLGKLPANSEGKFKFEIYVPHELNNQYSISSSCVQWIFSTEVTTIPEVPETGDRTNPMLLAGLLLFSGTGLMFCIIVPYARKKREVQGNG